MTSCHLTHTALIKFTYSLLSDKQVVFLHFVFLSWQMSLTALTPTSNTTHYVMQMSIDVHIRYLLGSLL